MKKGFTLSEVLITLTVLGVVAGITIPVFSEKITGRIFERSKADTLTKIIEAANLMGMNNVLVGYTTNEAFANEFQKYMKVTQRCYSSNLEKCFPAKFKLANGTEINTNTLVVGTDLKAGNNGTPTVGLGLANGTSMIIALKALTGAADDPCLKLDPMNGAANGTSGSGILACTSILYDVNGFKGPNAVGKDIVTDINVTFNIFACPGQTFSGLCVAPSDLAAPPINTCAGQPDAIYDSGSNGICATNYWAGAKKACASLGMRLPNVTTEKNIIYANKASIGNFVDAAKYWTYEEYGTNTDWAHDIVMSDGTNAINNKAYDAIRARCVK